MDLCMPPIEKRRWSYTGG